MWEKQTGTENKQEAGGYKPEHLAPGPARQPAGDDGGLLVVQVVLCLVIALLVFLAKTLQMPFVADLQDQYAEMLTQGVEFGTENPITRFASAAVETMRGGVQEVLARLDRGAAGDADSTAVSAAANALPSATALAAETGQGGFWPVNDKQTPPEGASLDAYTLPEALFLPVWGGITSEYGFRDNPVNGEDDFHAGVDIACAAGTEVAAALGGQVVKTGYNGYRGNYLLIRHAGGVQTLYQHLACIVVRPGEMVQQAQTVGMAGSTGMSTGPHLHFELILDGLRVDPLPSLPGLDSAE